MVAPRWAQLKIGPLLRRERDLRTYARLFHGGDGSITGLTRLIIEMTAHRIDESDPWPSAHLSRPTLKVFSGMGDYFATLAGHEELLGRELVAITRSEWVRRAAIDGLAPVGIHVRAGDFSHAGTAADFQNKGALRTPIPWFLKALRCLRLHAPDVPAFIVSDASDAELAQLLAEPNVGRLDTGSAISDMLALSRARVLLGSGGSSFSAWAAYLGAMPALTIEGQSLSWFQMAGRTMANLHTAADESHMRAFSAAVASRLARTTTTRPWWS